VPGLVVPLARNSFTRLAGECTRNQTVPAQWYRNAKKQALLLVPTCVLLNIPLDESTAFWALFQPFLVSLTLINDRIVHSVESTAPILRSLLRPQCRDGDTAFFPGLRNRALVEIRKVESRFTDDGMVLEGKVVRIHDGGESFLSLVTAKAHGPERPTLSYRRRLSKPNPLPNRKLKSRFSQKTRRRQSLA